MQPVILQITSNPPLNYIQLTESTYTSSNHDLRTDPLKQPRELDELDKPNQPDPSLEWLSVLLGGTTDGSTVLLDIQNNDNDNESLNKSLR
ncbi:MAG: hypothetical protein QS748_01425 [Candidatus Endonucleobacter bathymodioli]|uniref:Uncharacterized protein n=1 Tax=Candidatus Endonucleibacter bathymodioli TaxID=539814 RepID=A0AA90SCD3_9GAMM|nr:hypothetical protein [Candidatus Endonucleobacter bathymodioli]